MIDTPTIADRDERSAAVIHLTIPRSEIQQVMGPAISELLAVLVAQDVPLDGPVFSHHFVIDPAMFDFDVGVPVAKSFRPAGRVLRGIVPAATAAVTTYTGPYEGLATAWEEFDRWIEANGHEPAAELWESYVFGPESTPDPAAWRTELTRPLLRVAGS